MPIGSKPVHRTANTRRSTIEDMGIDHRGLDVAMTQEFLRRPDIVTGFGKMQGLPQLIEEFRFGRLRRIGGRDTTRLAGRSGSMSVYDFQRCSCPGHFSTPKH